MKLGQSKVSYAMASPVAGMWYLQTHTLSETFAQSGADLAFFIRGLSSVFTCIL